MPVWGDVLAEMNSINGFDFVRRKYLRQLSEKTERCTIGYYSGWQTMGWHPGMDICDSDRDGFMQVIHQLDTSKGLDLILHTPGGSLPAAHTIIRYLVDKFANDIRVIVPHTAMSAGTIIACSARTIFMGKHSSIGPIDPQIGGVPATGVLTEFERIHRELANDPSRISVWQHILSKYQPTFIGQCEQAIRWSESFTRELLAKGMFEGDGAAEEKINSIIENLTDYESVLAHERQIGAAEAKEIGLKVEMLEDDQDFQDLVLTVHHCFTNSLANTNTGKIIENNLGASYLRAY